MSTYKPSPPSYLLPGLRIPFLTRRTCSSSSSSSQDQDEDEPNLPVAIVSPWCLPSGLPSPDTASPHTITRTHPDTLRCGTCAADLAFASQIVSKGFTGRHGRAFLVSPSTRLSPQQPPPPSQSAASANSAAADYNILNVRIGRRENRSLVTGIHTVADITCAVCATKLGWKYLDAEEQAQRYKIGKFILETERIVCYRAWENAEVRLRAKDGQRTETWTDGGGDEGRKFRWWHRQRHRQGQAQEERHGKATRDVVDEEDIEFDSGDEDECEDLFSGTWDPAVVAQRRRKRAEGKKK